MSFNINELINNPQMLQSVSAEYICTGYMFDINESQQSDLEISEFMAIDVDDSALTPPVSDRNPKQQPKTITKGPRSSKRPTGGRY